MWGGSVALIALVLGGVIYNNVDKPRVVIIALAVALTGILWTGAIELIRYFESTPVHETSSPPATSASARPAATAPISRASPGRSFEVIHDGVGPWHRGQVFTEYDFCQQNRAPAPNPGEDAVAATNDYYEDKFDRLLRLGAVRLLAPIVPAAVQGPISRLNPGRTFQVIRPQWNRWREGDTFTEYDFRFHYEPPANPQGDPIIAANDWYEERLAQAVRADAIGDVTA